MRKSIIKIMIIDDSPTVRELLKHIFAEDLSLQVVADFAHGEDALDYLVTHPVDVITTDLNMPRMHGLEVTRKILQKYPIPIIIITGSCGPLDEERVFLALEAGALAVVPKPSGIKDPEFVKITNNIIETIKVMSEVKIVRRTMTHIKEKEIEKTSDFDLNYIRPLPSVRAVAIGASMGGPQALAKILAELPSHFPVPIYVVQHIAQGFIHGLRTWLDRISPLNICIAQNGEVGMPGRVYFAPDGYHMHVAKNHFITLVKPSANAPICPSIDQLFLSIAHSFKNEAVGVLLTGMGSDGANNLKLMKECGAYTIAQDEMSCDVFGMPREAILRGGVTSVIPLQQIAPALNKLIFKN